MDNFKQIAIDKETISNIINLSLQCNNLSNILMSKIPCSSYSTFKLSDVPIISKDSDDQDVRAVYKADLKLVEYLNSLPFETIKDVTTLMIMGKNNDYDKSLHGEQRFIDYRRYLNDNSLNDSKDGLIEYVTSKTELHKYLKLGLDAIGDIL